jgi:hypothetical protein
LKEISEFSIKRRIYNDKEMIKHCCISPTHDLIIVQYDGPHLFFYSYERAKPLGFLLLEDLIQVELLPNKNAVLLLCKDKLLVFSFKKFMNSISFFMRKVIFLWEKEAAVIQSIRNFSNPITSTGFIIFDKTVIATSNVASLQCKLRLNWLLIKEEIAQVHKDNYNPYRVAA